MIVVCALFYKLKNHFEGKESYWLSVKAINENIDSDSEAYRNLDTKEINKRKLFSELFTYELYPFFRKPREIRILDAAHILFKCFLVVYNKVTHS